MVEELFVYGKDGVRHSLNLNTPSGITLKWVSNMFNSLDKVNCSYSYTFKVPMTQHNRIVMDNAEDIRSKGSMLRKKLKAEYIQNGIPLFGNGNLYVSKIEGDSYSCVFTWDVLDGLQKLKDDGCDLNELRKALVDAGYADDELTTDGITEWYRDWLNNDTILSTFDNTRKILRPYYGNRYFEPNYTKEDLENLDDMSQGYPKPVVPVVYLINTINKAFGTSFKIGANISSRYSLPQKPISEWLFNGENMVTYGVIPLTGIDLTDNQIDTMKKELSYLGRVTSFVISAMFKGILGTYGIFYFEKKSTPRFNVPFEDDMEYIAYQAYDDDNKPYTWDFPSTKADLAKYRANSSTLWNNKKYVCVGVACRTGCPIKMEGKFYIDLPWFTKLTQEILDNLKLIVYSWKAVNVGFDDEGIERTEVASFTATKCEEIKISNTERIRRLYFNFMESEGYEAVTFQSDDDTYMSDDKSEYWFGLGGGVFDVKDVVFQEPFVLTPQVNDLTDRPQPHRIDTFTNLPEIDCMTFMKTLFYLLGGFPKIDKQGNIKASLYKDIKNNLKRRNIYNWSGKLLSSSIDEMEISTNVDGFKQNNYYMNKWDDLDRTEDDLKDEEDLYEDGIGNIICNDETLDDEQTVQQVPFYPPFLFYRKNPSLTDKTIKFSDYDISNDDYSVSDRGEIVNKNKRKYIESKEAYGYMHRIPYFDRKTMRVITWEENYGQSGFNRMSVLNPFKDILINPSYRYLQQIVENPYVITLDLLLNEFDLVNINYTKPVYIEKFNSYFAIISIQRDSKGVSKCELIKLPPYNPPVDVTISKLSESGGYMSLRCTSTSSESRKISIGYTIENTSDGRYIMHGDISLSENIFSIKLPTSSSDWSIVDVWLDHYDKGDYNDYNFKIG